MTGLTPCQNQPSYGITALFGAFMIFHPNQRAKLRMVGGTLMNELNSVDAHAACGYARKWTTPQIVRSVTRGRAAT